MHVPPRIYRRVPFKTAVRLQFDRFRGFIEEYSANLSLGGMFIRTESPAPVGTELPIEFRLGNDYELIRGTGRVVWVRDEDLDEDNPAGMGIRFLDLTPGSRELIFKMVERRVRDGGVPFDLEAAQELLPGRPPDPGPAPEGRVAPPPEQAPADLPPPEPRPAPAAPEEPQLHLDLDGDLVSGEAPEARVAARLGDAAPLAEETDEAVPSFEEEPEPETAAAPGLQAAPAMEAVQEAAPDVAPWSPEEPEPGPPSDPDVEGEPEPIFASARVEESAPETPPTVEDWQDLPPRSRSWGETDADAPAESFAVPEAPPPWEQSAAAAWRDPEPVPRAETGAAFADYDLDEKPRTTSWRRIAWITVPTVLVLAAAAYLLQDRFLAADEPLDIGPTTSWTASLREDETAPRPADAAETGGDAATGSAETEPGGDATRAAAATDGPDPRGLRVGDVVEREPEAEADPARRVEDITWSSHPGGTTFLVWTDGALTPDRWLDFPIGGPNPRHVVRILGIERPYDGGTVEVDGAQVTQVRTGLHTDRRPSELHLVFDLASPSVSVRSVEAVGSRLRIEVTSGQSSRRAARGGG